MPPTLDLSRTAHSKVIISPPRINLRRATSYNYDRGPLSSTSSRFSFNHLVFSPPPSPGLPSLSPPPRKPPRGLARLVRPSRIFRFTVWLISALVVFYVVRFALSCGVSLPGIRRATEIHEHRKAARENFPDTPATLLVTDDRGKNRWTVFIPESAGLPLSSAQYMYLCAKCGKVSEGLRLGSQGSQLALGPDSIDPNFIDVREAQDAGYIPRPEDDGRSGKHRHAIDIAAAATPEPDPLRQRGPVCEKSLTFVLEPLDAGLGKTLMMIWMAYGIAEKEGRAFFIDDSRWAYGKYSDIFQELPDTGCSAPPKEEMIPCPRQARHLIATTATAHVLFSGLGYNPDAPEPLDQTNQKAEFALARRGHDALFRLNKDDAEYVEHRSRDLMAKRIVPRTKGTQNGVSIGAHIRRGDRHPLEYQYRDSYIPLNKYADAARNMIENKFNHAGAFGTEDRAAKEHSFLILASDDPVVHESAELTGSSPAQDRIKLASKQAVEAPTPDRHIMRKFVDENFGWEGGFFAPMFWNLGTASTSAANTARSPGGQPVLSPETTRLRSLVGRAYMMDLAVLADTSDAIVCTASAAGCRLLAVMMGWESAMENGNWVNIDAGARWTGILW
ncbi:hypothetical protein OQA88_3924 [Cercophora sp. LCS_1]